MRPGARTNGVRQRFLHESRVAASIDHANIVPIYDAGESRGQLYIAMRLVEGTDLGALLDAEGALDPERALRLLGQAASALDAAHERGLVHRDVKPANMLLTEEAGRGKHVYLSDFGLARESGAREPGDSDETIALKSSGSLGTIDYASPEQIEGKPADARTDVYSLGCVLYETLTGQPPFHADSPVAVLFGHLSEPPPVVSKTRPELDAAIDTVVQQAMAKEPGERYPTCSELVEDAGGVLLPEPGLRERLGRRGIAAIAAAVALILVAVLVPALLLTGGSGEPAGTTVVTEPTLQRIDPDSSRLVDSIPLPTTPDDIAAGAGGVWLLDRRGKELLQLNPATGSVAGRVGLDEAEGAPSQLVVTSDSALVSFTTPGSFVKTRGSIWAVGADESMPSSAVSLAASSVSTFDGVFTTNAGDLWLLDTGGTAGHVSAYRFPPGAGEPDVSIPMIREGQVQPTNTPYLIAVHETSVWATSGFADSGGRFFVLWLAEPDADAVVTSLDVSGDSPDLAVGAGAAWISIGTEDVVLRVEPVANPVPTRITVGRRPEAIAFGEGAVWVANARDGTVSRIDPDTLDGPHD